MMYSIASTGFEAARYVPNAHNHMTQLHGHSFQTMTRQIDIPPHALYAALKQATTPFNYVNLNHILPHTDDLSLAQALRQALPIDSTIWLRSAPQCGVITAPDIAYLWWDGQFEAAHYLPNVPLGHKCGRLHGHRFTVRLVANATHTVLAELIQHSALLLQQLDHRCLNTLPELHHPTSEGIAYYLYHTLLTMLPGLAWVEVRETHSAGSQYDGQTFRIWKEQHFEAAMPFNQAGHYTGHSYLIRLMLYGNLDQTLGWVMDFGDVKRCFTPVYRQLDHHPLDTLESIEHSDCAGIAQWIYTQLHPQLPQLARIDLMEHPQYGVSLICKEEMIWPI